jgi:hypothetical protein
MPVYDTINTSIYTFLNSGIKMVIKIGIALIIIVIDRIEGSKYLVKNSAGC